MSVEFITRAEFTPALDRLEDRVADGRDEILEAVRDLKSSMNGQFTKQGEIIARHAAVLGRHGTDIALIHDRGNRDHLARWGVVGGGVLAVIAGWLGLK